MELKQGENEMDLSNAFATHPGVKAEKAEALNEDYAHAWNKDGIYYQAVADGNGRDEEDQVLLHETMYTQALDKPCSIRDK